MIERRRNEQLPAQAEVQCEPRSDLPVVLDEPGPVPGKMVLALGEAPVPGARPSQQHVGQTGARRRAARGIVGPLRGVNAAEIEAPAPVPARQTKQLRATVLPAKLEDVLSAHQREPVGYRDIVEVVLVGPEPAWSQLRERRRGKDGQPMVEPVAERVSRGALDAVLLVQVLGERDVKARREVGEAEPELVEHRRSERTGERRCDIVPVEHDRLARTAGGRKRQGPRLVLVLVADRVADEPLVRLADVVVPAEVVLIEIVRLYRRIEEVVAQVLAPGDVRRRVELGDDFGDWIHARRRNPVPRERLARAGLRVVRRRIVDIAVRKRLLREVPVDGVAARHRRGEAAAQPDARPLPTEEAEHPVLDERPACGHAILVLPERRLPGARAVREEIRAVKLVVAQELVKRPVQLVRTGLGRDDDLRAGAIAVFGRHVVGDHLELRYGIDGRFHRLRLEAQRAAGIARAVVAAVQQDVVLRGVHSGGTEASLAPLLSVVARPLPLVPRRKDTRGEQRQLEVIPAVQRHLQDPLAVDHLAHVGLLRLQQRPRCRDLNDLRDAPERQPEVDAHRLRHLEPHVAPFGLRETLSVARNGVTARIQGGDRVEADLVGQACRSDAGLQICDNDLRPWNYRARSVGDDSLDRAGALAENRSDRDEKN